MGVSAAGLSGFQWCPTLSNQSARLVGCFWPRRMASDTGHRPLVLRCSHGGLLVGGEAPTEGAAQIPAERADCGSPQPGSLVPVALIEGGIGKG